MSTEKLSELSKPVGFIEQSGMDYLRSGADADIWPDGGRGDDIPLYSQEYVSALKHESAVNWEAAASLNVENQELKKRIAELEQKERHSERQNVIDGLAGAGEAWSDIEEYMVKWDEEHRKALEAQPVPTGKFAGYGLYHAERDEFGSWLKATPQSDCSDAITKHGYVNVKLFTAPPAPAVPVELLDAMEEVIRISDRDHEAWDKAKTAITACRAAMLAQPVSSGYKLQDGWIACSERMPDADGAYWCWFGKEKPSVIQQRVCIWNDRNHEWCDSSVTHWMPLPAAPEGGNDHDTRR
ncbi:DUF551 domain-containing protein [Serratia marcescens]|uniref:DUF551 domain-containing protein n=1 Tax=Serratia marcescens TaxID=615 RepID=UPI002FD9460C